MEHFTWIQVSLDASHQNVPCMPKLVASTMIVNGPIQRDGVLWKNLLVYSVLLILEIWPKFHLQEVHVISSGYLAIYFLLTLNFKFPIIAFDDFIKYYLTKHFKHLWKSLALRAEIWKYLLLVAVAILMEDMVKASALL